MIINRLDYPTFMKYLSTLKDYGLTIDGVYERISEYPGIKPNTELINNRIRKAGFDI